MKCVLLNTLAVAGLVLGWFLGTKFWLRYFHRRDVPPPPGGWPPMPKPLPPHPKPPACAVFRPDHNGECLNCDEWRDAHTPEAIAAGEA